MQNVTHRLKQFIDHKKLSILAFETQCGISESVISKAVKNKTEFKFGVLWRICQTFPELNLNWIMTGNGTMLNGAGSVNQNILNEEKATYETKTKDKETEIEEKALSLLESLVPMMKETLRQKKSSGLMAVA